MINWFCRQTIRFNLLVIFFVLSIIPLSILITQNHYVQKDNFIEMASDRLNGIALGHSKLINQWFHDKLDIVKTFSEDPILLTNDNLKIKELLLNVIKSSPEFAHFIYVNVDGNVIVQTGGDSPEHFSDNKHFREALSGKAVVSEEIISNEPAVAFFSPVNRDGQVVGILAGFAALEKLRTIVDVSDEVNLLESYLVGDSGYYLVPRVSDLKKAQKELIAVENDVISILKNNDFLRVFELEENGNKKLIAFTRIPEAPAILVIQQDEFEAVKGAFGGGLKNQVYITLVLILVVLILALWLSNKISGPLEQISSSVKKIAQGDFGERIVLPFAHHEIRSMAEEINIMSEQFWTFQATIEHQILELGEQKREITIRNQELLDSQKIIKEQMDELEQHKLSLLARNNDLLKAEKQLTENNRLLEIIANTDQLTGTFNRRFFSSKLYQEIAAAMQNGQDFCITLLDIDHFKNVNDTYGHKVGDQVLKELVKVITGTVSDSDVVARFGGEEFIILAPNTQIGGGQLMAEKVRRNVENNICQTDAGDLKITVSIGIACLSWCELTHSIEQIEDCLFKTADKNLYLAKDLGRNRVVDLFMKL